MVNPVLIDTCQKCQEAVAELFQESEVAIDIEGVDLSRAGQVCLIQMCGASMDKVFLFDIHQMQDKAFEEGGLKQLLESPDILKVFYDVRADNDALFHLHGIQVQASYDVQVLWHLKFQHPEDIHLQGLKKILAVFLDETKVLTRAQIAKMDAIKEEGQKLFAPEQGGSYEFLEDEAFATHPCAICSHGCEVFVRHEEALDSPRCRCRKEA
ncbi:Exd1 [Symbiodinium pilosum]|uniref:Exd1 protein n=1 Tax=Symbiodinium pilosum TaxID=2952 RepID=A0A812WX77_SYMPI|nr:Exd1 [Symbiodinium pilosum]